MIRRAAGAAVPQPGALRRHVGRSHDLCLRPRRRPPPGLHARRQVRQGSVLREEHARTPARSGTSRSRRTRSRSYIFMADGVNEKVHVIDRADAAGAHHASATAAGSPASSTACTASRSIARATSTRPRPTRVNASRSSSYKGMTPVTAMNQGVVWPRLGLRPSSLGVRVAGRLRRAGALLLAALAFLAPPASGARHPARRHRPGVRQARGTDAAAADARAAQGDRRTSSSRAGTATIVDLTRVDQALRDAATDLPVANKLGVYEGDTRLPGPRIVSDADVARIGPLVRDLRHGARPRHSVRPFPSTTTLFWEQGILDVLIEYPIRVGSLVFLDRCAVRAARR